MHSIFKLSFAFFHNDRRILSKVVMTRHGQSVWNDLNRWAGWTDVKLSDKGINEALKVGETLKEEGFFPDIAYTSMMTRTIQTFNYIADTLNCHYVPLVKSWRLNEKHYGQLQGQNRSDVVQKFGEEQVHLWRRGYDIAPPALQKDDPRHPIHDIRYKDVPLNMLPTTESLKDTIKRVRPFWDNDITKKIQCGSNVLIVAHGNTLRSIMKIIENISDEDLVELNIPTATPILYEFGHNMQILQRRYLGDAKEIKRREEQVKNQACKKKSSLPQTNNS